MKDDVKKMKVVTYKGENIKTYTKDMLGKCLELERGLQLPANIVLTIADQLI
jgi:hypothetical protein